MNVTSNDQPAPVTTPNRPATFDEWERRMRAQPGFRYITVNYVTGVYTAIGDSPTVCTALGTY